MERGVLVQRSMGPRHIIMGGISAWGPAQVRFAKHDHVVETFAADRADESLNVSILPGRSGCDRMVPNAHCTDPLQEGWTIRGVSIPNEMSRPWYHGNASVTWRRMHSAGGVAFSPNDTPSR